MTLDSLRTLCLSFPGATEGMKWEVDICFMVGEKMFCVTGTDGHVSLKLTPEAFTELTERDGIIPSPYLARNHWVSVRHFSNLKTAEWKQYIRMSYDLVRAKLPKKVQAGLT